MTRMNNKGDDCYFYYYSKCTKGDACPFRHCEAAMGNETVCSLWQKNRCFRNVCKFRHMEIEKNRKEIPCYWENQPSGCQKFNCAFHHEKPRLIDGQFVAPDEGPVLRKENEETTSQADQVLSASTNMSNTTNPQLRGVIKVETQESVPSPTHPPVVINPVDDEDDEEDQFSEEGEDVSGVSPKKLLTSNRDESLDFGIKSLEEIRLGKALRASLNRADLDCFSSEKRHINKTGIEKKTIHSHSQGAVESTGGMSLDDTISLDISRKRKITDRLGKEFDEGGVRLKRSLAKRLGGFVDSTENVKSLRPVHERLGITTNIVAPKSPNGEPKPTDEIRIKTLEEIRQEKAAKSQNQSKDVIVKVLTKKKSTTTESVNKPFGPSVKTFSEVLHEKKKCQETKLISPQSKASTENVEGPKNTRVIKLTAQPSEVRVKTLEEIRKEKAIRMQENPQDTTIQDLPTSAAVNIRSQKVQDCKVDCIEDSTVTTEKRAFVQDVTVKSFEEIMREKRLRKQQEHAASAVGPEQAAQKTILPTEQDISQQTSSSISLLQPQEKSPEKQNKENSIKNSLKKCKSSTSVALPVQVPEMEAYCENMQPKMLSSKAAELRVRPKLNVKPSVIKPAKHEKPGQKRKAAGSAVAEVKPLYTPASYDEPTCKQVQLSVPSSSLEVEARVPQVSSTEQCPTKPFFVPQSPVMRISTQTGPRRASLSSARSSAPAGNSSAVDDLEDLLDEFTDDRIEDEIELDPAKGEDDLLLELSKMIDS